MPDSRQDVLAQQYRQQLIDREEIARRAMLKNYRGVWRGLGDQLDGVLGSLRSDAATGDEIRRENEPASEPALVRMLRSEYRINVVEGYRESMRLTYELSGKVKKWRWTSA